MPKLTPEIEQRIREAAREAAIHCAFRVGFVDLASEHILAALDDLAEARQELAEKLAALKHQQQRADAAEARESVMLEDMAKLRQELAEVRSGYADSIEARSRG